MLVNYRQQNVLGHSLFSFGNGLLSYVLICQNAIFMMFMLSGNFKTECFSFLVFNVRVRFTDMEVSLTRKSTQCNAKSASLYLRFSFMSA